MICDRQCSVLLCAERNQKTFINRCFFRLPFCLRVLFESAIRNADLSKDKDVAKVWSDVAESLLAERRMINNDDDEAIADDKREVLFQPGNL